MEHKTLWNGVKQVTFEGTESQMTNLELACGISDNDLPRNVIKEVRIYVVDAGNISDEADEDYLIDEELFKEEAEKQGTVYTLEGFQRSFNEMEDGISSNTHYIKIFEEEIKL